MRMYPQIFICPSDYYRVFVWGRDFSMNGAFERRTRVKETENLLVQLEKVYQKAPYNQPVSRLHGLTTHAFVFQQQEESELQNEGIEKEIEAIQKVGADETVGVGL